MPKVQPCGELDLEKKCSLVSEYMPKVSIIVLAAYLILLSSISSQMGGLILLVSQISAAILDEASNRPNGKGRIKKPSEKRNCYCMMSMLFLLLARYLIDSYLCGCVYLQCDVGSLHS